MSAINKIQISGVTYDLGTASSNKYEFIVTSFPEKGVDYHYEGKDNNIFKLLRAGDVIFLTDDEKRYGMYYTVLSFNYIGRDEEVLYIMDEYGDIRYIPYGEEDGDINFYVLKNGGGSSNIVEITQSEYDKLSPKDKDTLYVISDADEVDLEGYATKDELSEKQDKMTGNYLSKVEVGGSSISIETKSFKGEIVQKTDNINFKTINGQAIFGIGDIKIEGGGGGGDVPTPQTSDKGTDSNYIWSTGTDGDSRNVLSTFSINRDTNYVSLGFTSWGKANSINSKMFGAATDRYAGVMSASDKIKLDSIDTDNLVTKDEFNSTVGNIEELLSKI